MNTLNKKNLVKLIKINGNLLMLDEITSFKIGKKIFAYKKISKSEWFYKIHLINRPLMPGILQSEAMQQSLMCLLYLDKKYKNFDILTIESKNKFYSEIKGNKTLKITSNILYIKKNIIKGKSVIKVNNNITSSGEFTFACVKKNI
jgi:3-hydroxymyristoyl/3-hydroxydecanoyl-(acyl carrier protein) dehydratase